MASPQLEAGFTRIANEILDKLMRVRLHSRAGMGVVLWVLRNTYGFNRVNISPMPGEIGRALNVGRHDVTRGLAEAVACGLVKRLDDGALRFVKDWEKWFFDGAARGAVARGQRSATGKGHESDSAPTDASALPTGNAQSGATPLPTGNTPLPTGNTPLPTGNKTRVPEAPKDRKKGKTGEGKAASPGGMPPKAESTAAGAPMPAEHSGAAAPRLASPREEGSLERVARLLVEAGVKTGERLLQAALPTIRATPRGIAALIAEPDGALLAGGRAVAEAQRAAKRPKPARFLWEDFEAGITAWHEAQGNGHARRQEIDETSPEFLAALEAERQRRAERAERKRREA